MTTYRMGNATCNRKLISKIYKDLKTLDIKEINLIKKWSIDLNRRIPNDRETLKEMFNILGHQGNANQKDSEIPSYTLQNG